MKPLKITFGRNKVLRTPKGFVNDINKLNKKEICDYLYVSQEEFDLYAKDMRSFDEILKVCKGYK